MSTMRRDIRTTWLPMLMAMVLCPLAMQELQAEVGWRYIGDLNSDGTPDRLESGPQEIFGNAGGNYLLTLSSDKGPQRFLLTGGFEYAAETLDDGTVKTFRLWTYMKHGPNGGSLISHSVTNGKLATSHLAVVHGFGRSDEPTISDQMMGAVFRSKISFHIPQIDQYAPPSIREYGLDWERTSP